MMVLSAGTSVVSGVTRLVQQGALRHVVQILGPLLVGASSRVLEPDIEFQLFAFGDVLGIIVESILEDTLHCRLWPRGPS